MDIISVPSSQVCIEKIFFVCAMLIAGRQNCINLLLLSLLLTGPYVECDKHGGLPKTRTLYNVKKMSFASVIRYTEQVCLESFLKELDSFCFLYCFGKVVPQPRTTNTKKSFAEHDRLETAWNAKSLLQR